jgi:N,N'-diacetyllegionaminate synthase
MINNPKISRIPFGGREIGAACPVVIIAEIGINHEGSADICARMIEEAAKAGADAIKLQTIDADENYVVGTESHEIFSAANLSPEETSAMFDLARELGMEAFTTAGDPATFEWVERLAPAAHKISSGLLTNLPIIRRISRCGRTMLMSTGMAEFEDIDRAVAEASDNCPIGLFQCTSIYPAPIESLNLSAIGWLAQRYDVPAGFSDHSKGTAAAAIAVAAGATMIEKHFTLDPDRPGYDHVLSLDPKGLAEMVTQIREAEVMMGTPAKILNDEERSNAERFHRILIARTDIPAGTEFDNDNLGLKRPMAGTSGLAPRYFDMVLGRRSLKALAPDQAVTADVVEGEL